MGKAEHNQQLEIITLESVFAYFARMRRFIYHSLNPNIRHNMTIFFVTISGLSRHHFLPVFFFFVIFFGRKYIMSRNGPLYSTSTLSVCNRTFLHFFVFVDTHECFLVPPIIPVNI